VLAAFGVQLLSQTHPAAWRPASLQVVMHGSRGMGCCGVCLDRLRGPKQKQVRGAPRMACATSSSFG